MANGFGPYNIISSGEIVATAAVLLFAVVAFVWMAYRTSRARH
jgi:hypothetical protein